LGKDASEDGALEDAAKDIAFRVLIDRERQSFIENCRQSGRSVARAVYELAELRGYHRAEEKPKETPVPAQERVQRAKQQQAVTQSLSAMQTGGGVAQRKVTTRQQLLDMDPAELDAYVLEMDQKNPNWDKELF
jgi:hypothetical protein